MAAEQDTPATDEMEEVIEMKDNVCVGPFQAEILKGKNSTSACTVMHTCNGSAHQACADVESGKAHLLSPGLQVLHAYTMIMAGSKLVSIVVQNMTDIAIFLKKGMHVVHVVSAMLVPPVVVP